MATKRRLPNRRAAQHIDPADVGRALNPVQGTVRQLPAHIRARIPRGAQVDSPATLTLNGVQLYTWRQRLSGSRESTLEAEFTALGATTVEAGEIRRMLEELSRMAGSQAPRVPVRVHLDPNANLGATLEARRAVIDYNEQVRIHQRVRLVPDNEAGRVLQEIKTAVKPRNPRAAMVVPQARLADDDETRLRFAILGVNRFRGDMNCWACSMAVDTYVRLGSDVVPQVQAIGVARVSDVEDVYGRTFEDVDLGDPHTITTRLLAAGSGARGFVGGTRKDGTGHMINVWNVNGRVYFIDAQDGSVTDDVAEATRSFDQWLGVMVTQEGTKP